MGRCGEVWQIHVGRYEEVEILKGTQLTETCTLVLMIIFFSMRSDNKLFFHVSILLSSKLCFCMNQWAHDIFSNG